MKPSRFCIKPSTVRGAGRGLFAKKAIVRGERFEVTGILIGKGSASDTYTRYADAYKFRVGKQLLIPTGCGAMVNHSDTPCLEKLIVWKKLYLRALKSIKAGDELFFQYSRYARKRFKGSASTGNAPKKFAPAR
jgi:hypothetical protein